MDNTATVLVCVTDQLSCERLIQAGVALAEEYGGLPVRVLSVVRPELVTEETAATLQALYDKAAAQGADMTIYFNDTPAIMAAVHARQTDAVHLVVGTPGVDTNRFVETLKGLLPEIPLTMIDAQGQACTLPALSTAKRQA